MKEKLTRKLRSLSSFFPPLLTRSLGIIFLMAMINGQLLAQDSTSRISGVVQGANAEPLEGATVTVKNSNRSTVTDSTGHFSLSVPRNSVLVVSYIGYADQEVTVGSQTLLKITLVAGSAGLNEVVVVGYTTQRRGDLTGSLSTIKAGDISGLPVGGVDQILQGKAAGVNITQNTGAPGGGVVVRIRGIGTPNNNDPLYIIDGIPVKDGLNQLSPNDIESVSVLKDASAAAIYGSRASAGVVLITTKKGKSGKPTLSLNAYTGVQTPANLIKMANTRQYVNAFNIAAANDGREQIPESMLATLPDVDWQKETLNSAMISNVQLSLSGGNANTKYLLSAAYFTQEGMIQNSSNDRFNLRTSIDSRINNIFRVGTNLNLSYTKLREVGSSGDGFGSGNPGPSVMRYALFRTPATPVYDASGNYVDLPDPVKYFGDGLNPVGLAANTDRNFRSPSILGDVYLEVTPIDHLKLKSAFGINYIITDYKQFYPTWGSETRLQNSPNSLAQRNSNSFNYNWTNTAVYDWRTGDHSFNFMAGTEIVLTRARNLNAANSNFSSQLPSFRYLNNAAGIQPTVGSDESSASLSSVFGRVDYSYDSRYLASFTMRRDGSSRLDPSDRWGNFYSGSVGWRIDQEKFMEDQNIFSNLKLRASLGQLGNQEIPYYGYTSQVGNIGYYPFGTSLTPATAYSLFAKGNSNIKWETTTITDIGLDIGLLKGALNIKADYYRKITTDLLLNPLDPPSAGAAAGAAYMNNGKILNRGFDFEVDYQHTINKDWNFGVNANLSTIHNEVLALNNNQRMGFGRVDNNVFVTSLAVGQPIGAFYLYEMEGIFQNELEVFTHAFQGNNIRPGDVKFADKDGNGIIDENDRVYAGSAIPKITYAFTGTVGYRNFDLSVFFQGVSGNKIYNQVNTDIEGFYRQFNITERVATQSWHGEGTSNSIPRLSWTGAQNNKLTSTRFLEDGSYLRLKNLQVGYTLPAEFISRLKISSLRLYVAAQNLLTFTDYTGLDPEMATSANAAGDGVRAVGIDWGTYPSARTFTVGVNVNF
ncbi:MAG: TonB-dependent receptor [Candidatus Pseudobacter hemicellulosilyticus]|uniref:TonB-dependent receptor n=1 Tax=Candidatus Pseudobacter hemicellulosilyticus TaxID=3121375 RepID=A0AAJ6BI60_9BACT|nr:MAG: TonB-dependent receptor [Pseudobacter sp.]